ncbi:MAG TPA: ABC transporter ATP-binding protein, partial [Symbiobacteriaceae bacterium]|nr:ABC transporter ATP-binding protein [Symbiobacteriaceae bacterium]
MLKLQNVSKYYSRNGAVALGLRKVNLTLGLGEFVAVVGESGSGKSTLLHVMCGLDTYEDGELYINGEETSHYTAQDWENYRRTYVGFVSQNFNLIDSYTVLQNVEAALILSGYDPAKRRERALQIIERVGLTSHAHMKASKLSGGQMQRTVIARALAKDCPIIAADEPTGNLDSASSQQIIELLQEISRDKLVIVVTHNFAEVAHLATRKVTIHDGEVVENRQLQPAAPGESGPASVAKTSQVSWREALFTAVRNLGSTPLKTLLMFLVMLMLAFGSAFVYGSMRNLQDETAFKSGSPHFRNSMEQRVIVKRSANGAFTQDELEALAATPNVAALVRGDLALDQQVISYYPKALGNGQVDVSAQVMPGALVDEAKLTAGRRPETATEVAINTRTLRRGVAPEDLLGRTFEYTAKSTKFSLTIVGISEDRELGEVVFAHPEVLDKIAGEAVSQYQTFTYSAGTFQAIPFTPV